MKINPRLFPTIIIVTFVLFLLIALAIGFRPAHGGDSGNVEPVSFILSLFGGGVV